MIAYPLSDGEKQMVRWSGRLLTALAVGLVFAFGLYSMVAA